MKDMLSSSHTQRKAGFGRREMETNAELFATLQVDHTIDVCNEAGGHHGKYYDAVHTGWWLEKNRADIIESATRALLGNYADKLAA